MCGIRQGMEQRRDQRTPRSAGNQMEVQENLSISLWRSMEKVSQKLQESNVCCVGEPISDRRSSFNYVMFL